MLDLSHIPNSQQDVQIFYANQGDRGYQTWTKPRKCNFVYILSIDGGGGGASGVSTPSNVGVANGCGGGSGAVTRALINSSFVPDSLYIKVGKGGLGGSSQTGGGFVEANTGSAGESSGVFCLPNLSSQGNANQASSFIGGSTSAQGGTFAAGVNGSTASTLANNYLLGLTNFISLAGRTSSGGLLGTTPPNIDVLTSHIVTAGCAGAPTLNISTTLNGGGINTSAISPLIAGGIGGTTLGGNGADGYTSWKPFFSTGGAGGGNASTSGGVGGNGGNGGIGSGGGGGGNANAGTSGRGGRGGDGLVVIISF
jgi:hypothetical protein